MYGIGARLYIYDWRHVLQRDLLGQHRLNTFPPEEKNNIEFFKNCSCLTFSYPLPLAQ